MESNVIYVEFGPGGGRIDQRRSAFDMYCEAQKLDEDGRTLAKARRLYELALRIDPNMDIAITNLGNVRFKMGDFEEAEALYKRALRVNPSQIEARYNLGYCYLDTGRVVGAVSCFRKTLRKDPLFADAHYNLGMAYRILKLVERSQACFAKYVELAPTSPFVDAARSMMGAD